MTNSNKDKEFLAESFKKAAGKHALMALLDDLFTEDEISNFAQRLRIARGIVQDKTYLEVSDKIDASTSTVTKVGQIIKYGRGAFQKLFGGEKHGS